MLVLFVFRLVVCVFLLIIPQELNVGVSCGQVLLDFLWQSGPPKADPADICVFSWERTLFTETIGELSSSWACLQGELMSQVRFSQ